MYRESSPLPDSRDLDGRHVAAALSRDASGVSEAVRSCSGVRLKVRVFPDGSVVNCRF